MGCWVYDGHHRCTAVICAKLGISLETVHVDKEELHCCVCAVQFPLPYHMDVLKRCWEIIVCLLKKSRESNNVSNTL